MKTMKNILKYLFVGLAALLTVSCMDTLDTHPTASYDESTVWGSRATAEAFINATTGDVLSSAGYGSGASVGWQVRTPDGIQFSQVSEGTDQFALENSRPEVSPFNFGLLRRCNLIIEKVEASDMDDDSRRELAAAGHLLRGMTFFNAVRQCGRIVPITSVLAEGDSLKASVPMSGLEESYKLAIEDLQIAARDMAESTLSGVPNKYAAGVLLSRAALQAYAYTGDASYLDIAIEAAGEVTENGTLTSNYRNLFNQQGATDPEILWGYYRLPNNTTMGEFAELMRTYPNVSLDNMKNSNSPIQYKASSQTFECWAIYFPTQDMVDQYLVIDQADPTKAVPWWETSQYKNNVESQDVSTINEAGCIDAYKQNDGNDRRIPTPEDMNNARVDYDHYARWDKLKDGVTDVDISDLMYQHRDNRFDATIIHDKSVWLGETIETMLSGNFSQGVRDREDGGWYNTSTGYYWLKGIAEPEERAYFENSLEAHYVIARVGEAYMNLAEAYLCKGEIGKAVEALNGTRVKHGGLPASTASTEAEAWTDYMRERRVEMANECADIYYSYLRWGKYGVASLEGKKGGVIEDLNRPVYKIEISRDRKQILVCQHTINSTANRKFTERRYLLPISQTFLNTREAYGLDHDQVQGW